MSRWDQEQFFVMTRLWAMTSASDENHRLPASEALVASFIQETRERSIPEVNPEDIRIQSHTHGDESICLHADWWPRVHQVELYGGPYDGRVTAIAGPLQVVTMPGLPPLSGKKTHIEPCRYILLTWDTEERIWIFRHDS